MRRKFIILLAILSEIHWIACAAPIQPVRTLSVYGACGIVMDGIAEPGYSEVQTTKVMVEWSADPFHGESDYNAVFRLCWNHQALYLLANITDDVEHDYREEYQSPWMFDSFDLFLQLDTNTIDTSYGPNTVKLRFCRGYVIIETPGRAEKSEYGYYTESSDTGWIVELAIPWTAVYSEGNTPEDIDDYMGRSIGFDFSGSDSDNTDGDVTVGNRSHMSFWDLDGEGGLEDLAWAITNVFGYITLMEYEGCATPVENTSGKNETICYPNPAGKSISFPDLDQESTITIYTLHGMRLLDAVYRPGEELDISSLQSGLYVALINGTDAVTFIKK
jgi:hypothetical protein